MQFLFEDEVPGQGQIVRCSCLWGWQAVRMNLYAEFLLFSSWQEMTAKIQMKQMVVTQLFRP